MEKYARSNGVGMKKVADVRERLQQIGYCLSTRTFTDKSALPKKEETVPVLLYSGSIPVTEVFAENKFNKFRKYCTTHKLVTVGDIQSTHLDKFGTTAGVGKKKYDEVMEVMAEYETSRWKAKQVNFQECELYEELKYIEVKKILIAFQFEVDTGSSITLEDINGLKRSELKDFDSEMIIELQQKLSKIVKPKKIGDYLKGMLKENEYKIIKYRFEEKLTLEETGYHFSVTRERIRQIEAGALKKVAQQLGLIYFYNIILLISPYKTFIIRDELIQILGEENLYIVEIIKHGGVGLIYFEKLDAFFFSSDKKIEFTILDDFFGDLPNTFFFEEYQTSLEETFEAIGVEEPSATMMENLIGNYGFHRYGEIYTRG
ncbi:MAG: hypothetical protein IE909_16735, partial [Campylobacterales bacterium]|nr:hypothetical protein [Campylobacterales bacterium]